MKTFLMISTLALGMGLAQASWALTANDLVTAYQNDGFSSIEVTTGLTQIKVEAVKDGTRLEVVYDIATGAILKQESRAARPQDTRGGVEIDREARDFTGGGSDDDDDEAEDDHGGHGSDDGADHDVNDDHGGDRDKSDRDDRSDDDDHGDDNSGHGSDDDDGDDD